MVRRLLTLLTLATVSLAVALLGTGAVSSEADSPRYWVELDNAFGLVDDADVKIGGVRAGKVTGLELDRTTMRAKVGIEITATGFDDIRKDVRCETRPQSLIGEYFIDCQPGQASERLKPGDTIPVEQTETTIPVDTVNSIMRRPYRERFSILLSELGAGLAARGPDLNETIRRAVPALRQVDRLLAILREQRRTIRDLYENADRVVLAAADNRDDVARFVEEARDTARAAASEESGIRAQWRTLPEFLEELRPTLARLEETADAQIPALQNLGRAAPFLEELFETLGPYAEASRPSLRSLAEAAKVGKGAAEAARAPVAELRRAVDDLPEAAQNLAITLEHLDDPRFASEKDVRAGRGPNGGFTGLESLLRYFFAQSQAINLFDANSYMLKASLFLDRECANYTNAEQIKSGTSPDRCRAWLGPNQPGITSPDFTKTGGGATTRSSDRKARRADKDDRSGARDSETDGPAAGGDAERRDGDGRGGLGGAAGALDDLLDQLPDTPAPQLPGVPGTAAPTPEAPRDSSEDLLDFLLGG